MCGGGLILALPLHTCACAFVVLLLLAASRSALGLHRRGVDLDLSGSARRSRRSHPVLDLGRHRHEGLLHVRGVLGRRLQKGDAKLIGVFLSEEERLELTPPQQYVVACTKLHMLSSAIWRIATLSLTNAG